MHRLDTSIFDIYKYYVLDITFIQILYFKYN